MRTDGTTGHGGAIPKAEDQLIQAFHDFYHIYARRGDGVVDAIRECISSEFTGFGTGRDERFADRSAIIRILQEELRQQPDPYSIEFLWTEARLLSPSIGVVDSEALVTVSASDGESVSFVVRLTGVLQNENGMWRLTHNHGSMPASDQAEGDRMPTDGLKARNQELERRMAARTVELEAAKQEAEIEAALERVRTKAMAMRETEDLAGISESVFTELKGLDFAALRNTEIIINHDANESITSYYYSDYGVTGTIEVDYTTNETLARWAREIQTADDAFVEVVIQEDEMEAWRDYRLSLGYEPDPKLDNSSTIYYYSYSIGLGALSISSFDPVSIEQLTVLEQFRNVFNLAWQRYSDIATAKAQAREAQIQLALERIRTQSSLMQHSTELVTTSAVFHEQLQALGIGTEFSYVWLPDEAAGKHQFWATWTEEEGNESVHRSKAVTYDLDKSEPYTAACFAAWESDDPILVDFIPPDDIEGFFETWAELLQGAEKLKAEHFREGIYYAEGYMAYGCFGINIRQEPTDAELDILQRFALEFERAYSRFRDLQRAEAQVREAQIDAALEQIRSRTMAMHKPDELQEVVTVVAERLMDLGVVIDAGGVIICTYLENSKDVVHWLASPDFSSSKPYLLPYFDHRIFNEAWHSRESGDDFFSKAYSVEDKNSFFEHAFEHSDYRYWPEEIKQSIMSAEQHALTFAWSKNAAVLIPSFTGFFPSDDDKEILKRFARVFEQAYVRFLDLQATEAQAREAQIEAALERVRSRTMAMQSSDELGKISFELVKQVQALGVDTWHCAFNIYDAGQESSTEWGANADGYYPTYKTPRVGIFSHYYEIGSTGTDLHVEEIGADRAADHYDYLCTLPGVGEQLLRLRDAGLSFPESQVDHVAYFKYGYLIFITYEPAPQAHDVFRRFAKVFEQTYTRFLDIQRAEAQAREAEIEAALERVRSRALAMTESGELLDVVFKIRQEFSGLGLECGAFWQTRYTPDYYQKALTGIDGKKLAAIMELPRDFASNPTLAAWEQSDDKIGVFPFDTDAACQYLHHMVTKGKFDEVDPAAITEEMIRDNNGWTFVQARTSHGEIGYSLWGETAPTDEAKDVLIRFTAAFDLAYRRFEDLQQKEAHTREVQQQAALDRVRAEIASMRTSKDLEYITPVVWRELTNLGVPFFRCGVLIANETSRQTQKFLTTPDGAPLGAFPLPFSTVPSIEAAIDHWRRGEMHTDMWSRDDYTKWMSVIAEESQLESPDRYKDVEAPPESLALHFLPFEQGMLYLASEQPLSEEAVVLAQSLADAFAVAYARYDDFQRLETKNQEVEAAMNELQTTQQQLIQSEKMASLGALTAGIAHEIKNPLNFVNNFAALSQELVAELEEEDDLEQIRQLASELKLVSEKIEQHGKRADGIVHAMMQHARSGTGERETVQVNALVSEYLELAYHGKRAQTPDFSTEVKKDLDPGAGELHIVPQEIGRVLLNLIGNAFDAVLEQSAHENQEYLPTVNIQTRRTQGHVEIRIADNGPGINDDVKKKIFEPFFTTKPTGQGTGLGLSLSFDIVTQGHGGTLTTESEPGQGAVFIVRLPTT